MWRDPFESLARDYRLVPAAGSVLAAGRTGHRALALAMAAVAAVSPGRHHVRSAVRAAAGHSVSARTIIGASRQHRGSLILTGAIQAVPVRCAFARRRADCPPETKVSR